jgi:hypothetical protein
MIFGLHVLRRVARTVLLSVLFAVLLPIGAQAATRYTGGGAYPVGADICSVGGLTQSPGGPVSPGTHVHKPCLFCISSVPLFADALAPVVVAVADGVPRSLGRLPAVDIPPDRAATRPVSPRAPPGRA